MLTRIVLAAGLLAAASCSKSSSSSSSGSGSAAPTGGGSAAAPSSDTRLDVAKMPVELAGLVPALTTAAEVEAKAKDWPELQISKDTKYGGEGIAAFNGYPAINIRGGGREVSTIEIEGRPRIARVIVPTTRACSAIFADLGIEEKQQGCGGNRRPDPDEHRSCTATPDGKSKVAVSCRDAKELDLQIVMQDGTYGM